MIRQKYEKLQDILRELDSVVVAFSGGVDSTFLLKAAVETLGRENVLAITANSETYPLKELEEATELAALIGAKHEVIHTSELSIPGYAENTINRCYFCKKGLFSELVPILHKRNIKNIVYGLIADDLGEHRPGMQAAIEYNVRGPLQEANLFKEEIRELSQQMGLPTWEKPSFACLSSRIAYGETITIEKLKKVDNAEIYLRSLGIKQVRVRVHGDVARIEVAPDQMHLVAEANENVSKKLEEIGFTYVTLDLVGYKSGSMNKKVESRD